MVDTITPVVHGGRRSRWVRTVVLHALGAAISASALGSAVAWAGMAAGAPWRGGALAVGAAALAYAAREAGVAVPIPQVRRQVPESWRRVLPAGKAAFLYGLVLGLGYPTHLRRGTLVVVTVAAFVTGSPLLGAAILAPFGMARGLAVFVSAGGRTPAQVSAVVDRLLRLAEVPVERWVHGAVLMTIALMAVLGGDALGVVDVRAAAAIGLALVFAWAAGAKVVAAQEWRVALAAYRFPAPAERAFRVVVPAMEALIAALVLFGRAPVAGTLALAMLVAFSAAIVRVRRSTGDRVPCGCFGRRKVRDYRVLLLRNLGLSTLAGAVALGPRVPGLGVPAPEEVVPVALVGVGAMLAVLLLRRSIALFRSPPG